jgi:ribosomal-protein-alanine N-acetyltransferase
VTGAAPAFDVPMIRTDRLLLRGFTEDDLGPCHALFNDPEVTRYLPMKGEPVAMERVERAIARIGEHWRDHGYGIWAVADASSDRFLGQCGLNAVEEAGETEVLYELAREAWGRGLATEAAAAAVGFAFHEAGLERIVAYAVAENTASTRVMEKLGMHREAGAVEIFGLTCDRYAIGADTP